MPVVGDVQTALEWPAELLRLLDSVNKISGIRDALKLIVDQIGACGVILWEVARGNEPLENRRLFVQSSYFNKDANAPFYELPMSAISGQAIRDGRAVKYARLSDGSWPVQVNHPDKLDALGITAFATAPAQLRGGPAGSWDSALTFYLPKGEFQEEQFEVVRRAADLFPFVYRSILSKVSFQLVQNVQEILQHAHYPHVPAHVDPLAREALQQVVNRIKHTFGTLEVSIYLRRSAAASTFELMAKEWPWLGKAKHDYKPGDGMIGWVLQYAKPLQLLDMLRFDEDRPYYRTQYPGMKWKTHPALAGEARQLLGLKPTQQLPPLRYVGLPVVHENTVCGVVRGSVQEAGAYYFDDDLTQCLRFIADLIADWWAHWLEEDTQTKDNSRFLRLVDSLSQTNREALLQLASPVREADDIINLALKAGPSLAPEVDIFRVWMKQAESNELYLAGELNTRPVSAGLRAPLRNIVLERNIDERRLNAFWVIWSTKNDLYIPESSASGFRLPDHMGCRSFTAAPIMVDDEPRGVLAMITIDRPQPKSIRAIATFIARQLALYDALRRQLQALEDAYKTQGDLLLDFQHQIRSPVNMVHSYAGGLLKSSNRAEWIETLQVIQEAARRASSVAGNLKLFVDLARDAPPTVRLGALKLSNLFGKLSRAVKYLYTHKALGKKLEFELDDQWKDDPRTCLVDIDRLDLVLDNLLDNTVKYSFGDTKVRISTSWQGHMDDMYICVSFENQGLEITPEEAATLATKRGYRGSSAVLSHPEGTGIGLWMVGRVLKSMKGRLQVFPTNANGINTINIYLKKTEEELT